MALAKDSTLLAAIPVSRDQFKPTDVIRRATTSFAQYSANGTLVIDRWEMTGFASFCVQFVGDTNNFAIEGSNDLILWTPLDVRVLGSYEAPAGATFTPDSNAPTIVAANKQTRFVQIRSGSAPSSRPSGFTVVLSQTPFVSTKPLRGYGPDQSWTYVPPAGGIVNATAVTIKTAVSASKRNIATAMQLDNGGGTGTEVILTDSVTSGVIWRGFAPPASTRHITFDPPLRLSANAALTLALTAASGAAVYPNIQGIVGLA